MKKIFAILAISALFAACGNSTTTTTDSVKTDTTVVDTVKADTVSVDSISVPRV